MIIPNIYTVFLKLSTDYYYYIYLLNYKIMNDTWKIYKDVSNEWRWERKSANGNIVGASTEGYKNREDCVANAKRNGYTGS